MRGGINDMRILEKRVNQALKQNEDLDARQQKDIEHLKNQIQSLKSRVTSLEKGTPAKKAAAPANKK